MIISVINHTDGDISDAEIHATLRAINRQIASDFQPYWSLGATLRLEGRSQKAPSKTTLSDMRGDAIIYLWNQTDVEDAIGYHDANHAGIPFGFVFTKLAQDIGEPWSVTMSHEALELIADPEANLLVQGPHPSDPDKYVFHWYEMCDAVQAEIYKVDGIDVSNFLLPLYFTASDERGGRNDFLGTITDVGTLRSFGINPGGYIGYFNPESNEHETVSLAKDKEAARRLEIKSKYRKSRRSFRYQNPNPEATAARRSARSRGMATGAVSRAERRPVQTGEIEVLRSAPVGKDRPDSD